MSAEATVDSWTPYTNGTYEVGVISESWDAADTEALRFAEAKVGAPVTIERTGQHSFWGTLTHYFKVKEAAAV